MTSIEAPSIGFDRRLRRDARLERRICWHAYAPDDGDPVWQISSGTPFATRRGLFTTLLGLGGPA